MNNIIIYKYFFKDILIDLNINYFHIDSMQNNEFIKFANVFNILNYYNVFRKNKIEFKNIFVNPSDIIDFLIKEAHKYNNTQSILMIIYSYIITYYLAKENYNLLNYQNRYFKKYNIDSKSELAKITGETFRLSVLEYQFLDELFRFAAKYPGIKEYHAKSLRNFDLLEKNILFNNKFSRKKIAKNNRKPNNSMLDDEVYEFVKANVLKTIKEFNSKLY